MSYSKTNAMKSIFDNKVLNEYVSRIENIQKDTSPKWGKMNATEMFAHCSLVFEYNNGQRQAKVNPLMKFFLKPMMRNAIVGPKPYKPNSPTAPYFRVSTTQEFNLEKARLIQTLTKYSKDGAQAAEAREHAWLGKLSGDEWSWCMIKHLDHHLNQFGV